MSKLDNKYGTLVEPLSVLVRYVGNVCRFRCVFGNVKIVTGHTSFPGKAEGARGYKIASLRIAQSDGFESLTYNLHPRGR